MFPDGYVLSAAQCLTDDGCGSGTMDFRPQSGAQRRHGVIVDMTQEYFSLIQYVRDESQPDCLNVNPQSILFSSDYHDHPVVRLEL